MRRLAIIAALVGLALGASACTTSPTAATVGGSVITQATLDGQLSELATSADAACVFATEFGLSGATVAGAGQGTVTTQAATVELDNLVLGRLLSEALARRHVTLTTSDLSSARADLTAAVAASLSSDSQSGAVPPACAGLTANPVAGLPRTFDSQIDRFLALQEQFEASVGHVDVSSAGVARYYAQHQVAYREACLDVVVADSQVAAQGVRASVAHGESFAAAAVGPGADTQVTPSGGQLPCELQSELPSTFGSADAADIAKAAPGTLLAPMPLADPSTGATYWLVVKVASASEAPLSSVASSIRQQLLSSADGAAQTALEHLVRDTPVTVDPRYGTWEGKVGLQPPTPPPSAIVLDPAADESAALALGTPVPVVFS